MFRPLLFLLFLIYSLHSAAQSVNYDDIVLDKKEDYNADADKAAGTAAQYLLSTPIDRNNSTRVAASRYMVRWMTGTPNFSFEVGEDAVKISKTNGDLLMVYMAAMVKYCLDNPSDSKDTEKVRVKTIERVLDYCKEQNVPIKGELKKYKEKREKGEL